MVVNNSINQFNTHQSYSNFQQLETGFGFFGRTRGERMSKSEMLCSTQLEKYRMTYRWDISEFDSIFPRSMNNLTSNQYVRYKEIKSPTFTIAVGTEFQSDWAVVATLSHMDMRWCLGLYVMLVKEKCRNEQKIVDSMIKIVNQNGETLECGHLNQVFEGYNSSWGWNCYKDLDMIHIHDDSFLGCEQTLHVVVEMTLYGQMLNVIRAQSHGCTNELEGQKKTVRLKHMENMENLFCSEMLSDAVIVCGSREFPVHVNILSAHSEVLQKIFETEMKEGITRRLEIEDVKPITLELMLPYLYTGDISTLLDRLGGSVMNTGFMIQAAEKYMLYDLKNACFSCLTNRINLYSAGELAVLVHFYNPTERIKVKVITYCAENWAALCKTPSFLKYLAETPEAFKDHLDNIEALDSVTQFQNSRFECSPRSSWKLPFVLKMIVAAYFMGLATRVIRPSINPSP